MKIVISIALWGVLCCAPLFILGDENTNAPVAIIAAPTSVPVTNQPPQGFPANDPIIESVRQKAEAGNAKSQSLLAECYYNGFGVEKDAIEAAKWYRKAADQGDATAQYNLGMCYENGTGVQKDVVEAVKWFRKSADQGNPDAQCDLGVCYQTGDGVEKDAIEAVKWHRKAADWGDAKSQLNLGVCYYMGYGVEKNFIEAAKWFRKAADQGCVRAEYFLGICYEWGDGVEKDVVEAVKWYRKAADQGDAGAQWFLGMCYQTGEGVPKDVVESAKWYRKAADQGDAGVKLATSFWVSQIASHAAPASNDSTAATPQPTPSADSPAQHEDAPAIGLSLNTPSTAPKPTIYDDPQIFENYYGQVNVLDASGMKVRIWRRENFVIMHMDYRPSWMALDVSKADKNDINEREMFELADRFCGKVNWVLKNKNEKGSFYETEDRKCTLNFYFKDLSNLSNPTFQSDHVTFSYLLSDKSIEKL